LVKCVFVDYLKRAIRGLTHGRLHAVMTLDKNIGRPAYDCASQIVEGELPENFVEGCV